MASPTPPPSTPGLPNTPLPPCHAADAVPAKYPAESGPDVLSCVYQGIAPPGGTPALAVARLSESTSPTSRIERGAAASCWACEEEEAVPPAGSLRWTLASPAKHMRGITSALPPASGASTSSPRETPKQAMVLSSTPPAVPAQLYLSPAEGTCHRPDSSITLAPRSSACGWFPCWETSARMRSTRSCSPDAIGCDTLALVVPPVAIDRRDAADGVACVRAQLAGGSVPLGK